MHIQLALLIILNIILGELSYAGGWSSGGGELLKDSRNPWFLNNTDTLTYCVKIDETNFGISAAEAQSQIVAAINFWKQEFETKALIPKLKKFGPLKIASQKFNFTECTETTDISFQFGVLSKKQAAYIKTPQQFGAITVRTKYASSNLRAQGFVYVSPPNGPLAYDLKGGPENAWAISKHRLLYLTLIHELGHIFGLSHIGSLGELMSEGFIEYLLSQSQFYLNTNELNVNKASQHFFSLTDKTNITCLPAYLANVAQYFPIDAEANCIQLIFKHDSKSELFGITRMEILTSKNLHSPQTKISEIDLSIGGFFPYNLNIIWLPKGQKIFTQEDFFEGMVDSLPGPSLLKITKKGIYKNKAGHDRGISVQFIQGSSVIDIYIVGPNGEIEKLL